MNKKTATYIASLLGVFGLLLILAGPAFHLVSSKPALYAGLACWFVGGAIGGFVKGDGEEVA